ncbi:hypothetical protein GUA87_14570 [Sneathiella sp. P13V-1]|uniref:hypothetical protein n=1 Tax=Sneathiella sp. P13V-1 TaxID=2697366 RepID=UPI00187B389C|nr:hypothetical protein [Sneathiella sp. P13V-1]MBE7638078.1 hypothetical protein [Sneathiella sp. P13V-1]
MPYKKPLLLINAILSAALLLTGCQPLERPFQPEHKASVRSAPGPRAALYIAPVKDGPSKLDELVVKQLQGLGIAAYFGEKIPYRYSVSSKVEIKEGASFVTWKIHDPSGKDLNLSSSLKMGDLIAGPSIEGVDLNTISLKSASDIDILLGGTGINYAKLTKPVLYVPIVQGAPGDGAESLSAALQDNLSKMGLDVLTEQWKATYVVKGTVSLTPPRAGTQVISLLWQLERRNGEYVGKIEQKNRIRAGSLNGPWGPVAEAAASGAARGLIKLLREAEPDYFRSN